MTDRPPALGDEAVARLKSWLAGGPAPAGKRAARVVARPIRRAVVRLVDPSLRATLDQLRAAAAARQGPAPAEVEVLRAELLALSRRLDAMERALAGRMIDGAADRNDQ